jgi:hypothetical protein
MRYETGFAIRYETENPVPISDIIASLQGVEAALRETAAFIPRLLPGISVQHLDIKVREIAQASPLREMFLVAMIVAFQKDLVEEVPNAIQSLTGLPVPDSMDTLVTVVTLTIMFYGVGALRTLVFGTPSGPAEHQFDRLVAEVAHLAGLSEEQVRDLLDERYGEKKHWRRLRDAVGNFFRPSKRQDSASIEVNTRILDHNVVKEVPADFVVENAEETSPFRSFENVRLEIHAQDKDHGGKGWAAVIPTIADRRIPLKLMLGLQASEIWGHDEVRGDVTVIYDRVADGMVPKAIHLHKLAAGGLAASDPA